MEGDSLADHAQIKPTPKLSQKAWKLYGSRLEQGLDLARPLKRNRGPLEILWSKTAS